MEEQTEKKELISSRESRDGDFGIAPVRMIGNLGKDAEMSYTPGGKAVTRFSLAVWNGKNNDTRWFGVTVWEDLAEEAATKLRKGMRVEVAGRLSFRLWQGKDLYDINANWIQILVRPEPVAVTTEIVDIEADRAWQIAHANLENTPF